MGQMESQPLENHEAPWGTWEVVVDARHYKIKRITVRAHQRLSYQKHAKRAEHWIVVQGIGTVTLNDQVMELHPGSSVDIPMGSAHRMANEHKDSLVFIEIQTGQYFGEDDIVRLQDDYGRA